jgi:hypothetical protein
MVAPLSKGGHPRLHLREFGICNMSTSTTQEGKRGTLHRKGHKLHGSK